MSPADGLCKGPEAAHSWRIFFFFIVGFKFGVIVRKTQE